MYIEKQFTKEDIDHYLYLLAREYKKRNRKSKHVELILVGGASVLLNYGFRDMTTDIDAMILADAVMKEAIMAVAENEDIPDGWLNADFQRSASFSNALVRNSSYYKTYANILEVRTVKDEYLIAMKLVSGRNYKRDLSDIAGIIKSCRAEGREITFEMIDKAVVDLYGKWDDNVTDYTRAFLGELLNTPDLSDIYDNIKEDEDRNKAIRLSDLKKTNEKEYM
ncbi:MAG: hypothetical protein IJH95_07170 [Mogibacterium sp.]|nr:hypothetical protein [Mogibacterium sp.]